MRDIMKDIICTSNLVWEVLLNNRAARNSDNVLYLLVCDRRLKEKGLSVDKLSFKEGLLAQKEYNLPNFETVRRTRQKLQAQFPELIGSKDVSGGRTKREKAFREYARKEETRCHG